MCVSQLTEVLQRSKSTFEDKTFSNNDEENELDVQKPLYIHREELIEAFRYALNIENINTMGFENYNT